MTILRYAIWTGCAVPFLAALLSVSCSLFDSPQLCASQQATDPRGPLLREYMLALAPSFAPHPRGYNSSPSGEAARILLASAIGLCGQPVCAASEADARAAFAAVVNDPNPADPLLYVAFVGATVADGLAANPRINTAWAAAGSPCIGGAIVSPADAGAPCAFVGGHCDSLGAQPWIDCCATQSIAPGGLSSLVCEPDDRNAASQAGTCRVDYWSRCVDDDQCFHGQISAGPYDTPTPCQSGVCCIPEGHDCYYPDLGGDIPNRGCCQGLDCVADAIGNGYVCQ